MIQLYRFNILYILLIFIWQSIQTNLLKGFDGAGRINFILTCAILFINLLNFKNIKRVFFQNAILKIALIALIYKILNSYFLYDPMHTKIPLEAFVVSRLVIPFTLILTTSLIPKKHINTFLLLMIGTLYFSSILFMIGSNFDEGKFSNKMFNINEIVLVLIALIACIILYAIRVRLSSYILILLLIFPTIFILFSGSRMGFGAYLILVLGYWFIVQDKKSINFIFKMVFIGLVCYVSFQYITDNTVVGKRLMSTTEDSMNIEESGLVQGTVFEKFGDRGIFYIKGWALFVQNPVFGIGLLNFNKTNNFVCHVEYIIHLCELGSIGFLFYIFFLRSLWINIRKRIRYKDNVETHFLFCILICILFSGLVLFLYNSYAIAALFGIMSLLTLRISHKIK